MCPADELGIEPGVKPELALIRLGAVSLDSQGFGRDGTTWPLSTSDQADRVCLARPGHVSAHSRGRRSGIALSFRRSGEMRPSGPWREGMAVVNGLMGKVS